MDGRLDVSVSATPAFRSGPNSGSPRFEGIRRLIVEPNCCGRGDRTFRASGRKRWRPEQVRDGDDRVRRIHSALHTVVRISAHCTRTLTSELQSPL